MLKNAKAMATVAVKDIKAASRFYEGTLGLKAAESQEPSVRAYDTGGSTLLVYVSFEHYDMPGMARQGDLHVAGDMKVAWFKDPDGNIHSLINQ